MNVSEIIKQINIELNSHIKEPQGRPLLFSSDLFGQIMICLQNGWTRDELFEQKIISKTTFYKYMADSTTFAEEVIRAENNIKMISKGVIVKRILGKPAQKKTVLRNGQPLEVEVEAEEGDPMYARWWLERTTKQFGNRPLLVATQNNYNMGVARTVEEGEIINELNQLYGGSEESATDGRPEAEGSFTEDHQGEGQREPAQVDHT